MSRHLIPIICALLLGMTSCQRSLTDYVNPFVGTDGHGHTFPGAILPFGFVQVSPDTRLDGWDGCSGYHYSDDTIYGFSHTHLSGTGCSDYGDLLLMPFSSEDKILKVPEVLDYSFYLSPFSHRNEKAEPGYYRVVLDRNRVMAELTVHGRTALHRYTYPNIGPKGFVIDLKHRDVVINSAININSDSGALLITGYRTSAAWNPEQNFYFAMKIDGDIDYLALYKNDTVEIGIDGQAIVGSMTGTNGQNCKALISFAKEVKEVTVYVGISAVDEKGAINNLKQSEGVSFQQAKKEASAIWEKALGQIEVEGGSKEDRTNFYTALYHCMTSPYLYSDADGRYRAMRNGERRAENGEGRTESGEPEQTIQKVQDRNQYTVFSVWDTYRALHPLLNIIDPNRSRDFVLTFLDHYNHSGELTMWELASHETHCMIGYHSASVILDAYRTGVLDGLPEETLNELLEAMIATSNLPMLGRTEYARDGYLSSEYENESVSKTLEYAYDDWCIALFAKYLEELAEKSHPGICKNFWSLTNEEYLRRSQSWKNIMDSRGFMHARRNGAFVTPFDPTEVNNHYTEANCWQYSTYVPHDINSWIAMLGGDDKAELFLDSLFFGSSKMTGRDQSDITGIIGQYAHGNEPSHHAAYLYAYIGKQWKSAELVRRICTDLYHNSPDGLCGNEDCGQMSAWYVMSAMGFYPVCPGSGQYVIGSPLFDKVTIHLQNGKDIVIDAKGQSRKNCYISSLRLNGAPYDKAYITFEQLRDGCTLDFEMSGKADKKWASAKECRPSSVDFYSGMSVSFTAAPIFENWQQSFEGEATVTISSPVGDSIYYTLDGSTPTQASTRYTGPITVSSDAVIKAVSYNRNSGRSAVITHIMTHMVNDRKMTYITKPDPQYYENGERGLIDRLHGTENFRIGGWQGWQGDCEVVIDLLEPRTVSRVATECLESMRAWIFFPQRVIVEISDDGKVFRPFGSVENKDFPAILERQEKSTVASFTVASEATTARYVRIKAVNFGKLPAWHVSAGAQAWLFVDEITVE